MITPLLKLDSKEAWWPVAVEASLAVFGYEWDDHGWRRDGKTIDRIDFPSSMLPTDFGGFEPTGYHRVAQGGDLYWHQFWTWWPYNPKVYAGFGAHEGDWEMVQLGCKDAAGDEPVLMTCSQHDGGEKREFWRVTLENGMPVHYAARDSHANYFEAHRDVTDIADGAGQTLDLLWAEFEGWLGWPGKWGNSDNSPGPLSTRRAWQAPHAWHGQAR